MCMKKENILKDKKYDTDEKSQIKDTEDFSNISEKISIEEQLEKTKDEVKSLQEQLEKTKDESLRAIAEMENIRKRAEKDIANIRKFGVEKLVKEFFPVLDSIEQALKLEVKFEETIAIKKGIELTVKMLTDIFKNNGVEEINPQGEEFDPNLHEAITMIPNSEFKDNVICDVFQKGYLLNGRVVRAAKVVVVKN